MTHLSCFSGIGKSAAFLTQLRVLRRGEHLKLKERDLRDMEFPVSPLERMTLKEKIEFFRSRCPFYCAVNEDLITGDWTFRNATGETIPCPWM